MAFKNLVTRTIILTIVTSQLVSCGFEGKDDNQDINNGNNTLNQLVDDLKKHSESIKKDTALQVELALMDWAFAQREELSLLLKIKRNRKVYLVHQTSFLPYANKRGINQDDAIKIINTRKLNWRGLERIAEDDH